MKTTSEYIALLRKYMAENAHKYGIVRMGIFGSVARGEQTENSDVDVCVEGQLHGFFALAGIKQELEELLAAKWILYACEIEWIHFYVKEFRGRAFMYDTLIAFHILDLIQKSLERISFRFRISPVRMIFY